MKHSKIFFILLATAGLLSFGFAGNQNVPRNQQMIIDWQRAHAYTMDYIAAATDDVITFKPTPQVRSFAEQMLHVADDNYGFAALAAGKKSPTDFGVLEKRAGEFKTKAELARVVQDSYLYVIAALREMDNARLSETIPVFKWNITREETFDKAFEHQTHHRGQTTMYLRLKGIKPPDERLF
jgi:uncharacterized damage-inducible protein DinB